MPDSSHLAQLWMDALNRAPRLGWAEAAPVVQAMPEFAKTLGVGWLGVVRDDLTQPLHGGSKVRKLDYLLAAQPWASAAHIETAGAIGSGHLVACAAAAQVLHKQLHAHIFAEPDSAGVVENLAYTVSHTATGSFYRNRISLALFAPRVLLGHHSANSATILPGGTHPRAMVGLVRAGLQLAQQVRDGVLPRPDRLYVAFGSGGTAVGLAAGLALGGLTTTVHGVLAVEAVLASRWRLRALQRQLHAELAAIAPDLALPSPCPLVLDASQVGPGYGHPTPAAQMASAVFARHSLPLEPVYTGKAAAALLADARAPAGGHKMGAVLYWHTLRRPDALPCAPGWTSRLPLWLQQSFDRDPPLLTRRRVLAWSATGLALAAVGVRQLASPRPPGWHGQKLSVDQAATLHAACAALLPPCPPPGTGPWPWLPVVAAIDRSCAAMPLALRNEIDQLLMAVGHVPLLRGMPLPFAALQADQQLACLRWLSGHPPPLCDAFYGLCNLVMLGYYQLPMHFEILGFEGPMVAAVSRPMRASYARLAAPPSALPPGLQRG